MTIALGLSARGLRKSFRGATALDGVDLDVRRGSVVAMTGQNGAGKTTTLRVFATVLRADAGAASVLGYDTVRDAARVRSLIGVALVNERSVYWRLSGRENLAFFARIAGVPRRLIAGRCDGALAEVGLDAMGDKPAAAYSAGQRQRLLIARAAIAEPEVLLIDEPMRGLDDEGIERVRSLIAVRKGRGATIVIAGAIIGDFGDLCDGVVELEHGRVAGRRAVHAGEPA